MGKTETADYPKYWDWDEDGYELAGTFVRLGKGVTAYGEKAFVVLDVGGVERTIWLHHEVLRNLFARELHRRPDKEFIQGERMEIRQLGTRDSGTGNSYMNYRGEFPDGPASSHADILAPPPDPPAKPDEHDQAKTGGGAPDDDIPFR